MIMAFGRFVCDTGYGRMVPVNGIKRTLAISKEDQDQEAGKPATLIKGVQLEKLSCEIQLLRVFEPLPESVIVQLEKLLNARRPEKLIIGGKVVGKHRWLLIDMGIDYSLLNADGKIIEAKLTLSFEEYAKAGSKQAEGKAKAVAASSPGLSSVKANDAYRAKVPTSEDRASKKREVMERRLNNM